MKTLQKSVLATAIATALNIPATGHADIINLDYQGLFTMLLPGGEPIQNTDYDSGGPWYGGRTPVTGTLTFDTNTGAGSGTLVPFSFTGSGPLTTDNFSLQAIGNGAGSNGPLVLANMELNWHSNNGIPVSVVLDASGLFAAVSGGLTTGQVITGGVIAASEGALYGSKSPYTLPMGPGPMVTTTWNTTTIGGAPCTLGCNPSGTLPLIADSIGGSPMLAGPFEGFNVNLDIMSMQSYVYQPALVPIPAAVWLFGSGLVGLIGVARRRRF